MLRDFFKDSALTEMKLNRIVWLVSHHHTYGLSMEKDYLITLKTDYILNAGEGSYSKENAAGNIFHTKAGTQILQSIFCNQ